MILGKYILYCHGAKTSTNPIKKKEKMQNIHD